MNRILILFLSISWLACSSKKETATSNEFKIDTVRVFLLKKDKVKTQTSLPGELIPYERVEIHPKVIGYIKELKVDIGSVVKKGQTLLTISAPEIESRLGEAAGKYQAAKSKYGASLDTYKRILAASKEKGVISEDELQRARNQMLSDSADYEAAKYSSASFKQVGNYLAILAPFDGIITQRNFNEGAYVGAVNEKAIVVIENNSKLRLRVAVPESLTGVSLKNNKAKFNTKANPTQVFEANLVRKAGSIDMNTRTEMWEFEVLNKNNTVKAGAFATVALEIYRNEDSFIVPFSSVVTTLEKKFVIKVTRDSTLWIDVSQGLNLSDKTEIFGRLNEGDTIVIKGNEELRPKQRVATKFQK
jgi:RND family efflux transporter MFP subunit